MYKQIEANKRNTLLLLFGFVALIAVIGGLFGYALDDWNLTALIVVVAVIYAAIQYFLARSLAVMMTGAREISKKDDRRLYNIVENLAITAGLPMPKVYIIDDPAPNAMATGRDPQHAMVAATTGLLAVMDDKELTAVMAHELSHVKNYDIRVSLVAFSLVCVIGLMADVGSRAMWRSRSSDKNGNSIAGVIFLVVAILAPVAASLTQLAVSREREYLADASAAHLTRYPEGMIAALQKLETHAQPMKRQNPATASFYISNPMKKKAFGSLWSTHPPIAKRIERLERGKWDF